MPKVSVIIPAYNPGTYLDLAVDSVINQTYKDWEIVIVDDGSTEDIAPVAHKHPAITLIRQENRGLSAARNAAILASSGEYVAFLDADDLWLPTKLEKQVACMEANVKAGFCETQFEIMDASGHTTAPGYARPIRSYEEMLEGCSVCVSSVMVRRSCLAVSGLFDPFYKATQDYDMWLKLSHHFSVCLVPSVETRYRWHSQNMSQKYSATYAEITNLLRKHQLLAQKDGNRAAMKSATIGLKLAHTVYGAQAFDHSRASLRRRALPAFISHFAFAFTHSPQYVTKSVFGHLVGGRMR